MVRGGSRIRSFFFPELLFDRSIIYKSQPLTARYPRQKAPLSTQPKCVINSSPQKVPILETLAPQQVGPHNKMLWHRLFTTIRCDHEDHAPQAFRDAEFLTAFSWLHVLVVSIEELFRGRLEAKPL
jgi:hypothetical protein